MYGNVMLLPLFLRRAIYTTCLIIARYRCCPLLVNALRKLLQNNILITLFKAIIFQIFSMVFTAKDQVKLHYSDSQTCSSELNNENSILVLLPLTFPAHLIASTTTYSLVHCKAEVSMDVLFHGFPLTCRIGHSALSISIHFPTHYLFLLACHKVVSSDKFCSMCSLTNCWNVCHQTMLLLTLTISHLSAMVFRHICNCSICKTQYTIGRSITPLSSTHLNVTPCISPDQHIVARHSPAILLFFYLLLWECEHLHWDENTQNAIYIGPNMAVTA